MAIAIFFINYIEEIEPGTTSARDARFLAIAQAIFALGRLAVTILMKYSKPRWILMCATTLTLASLAAAVGAKGSAGIAMLSLEFFAKACISPTIFSLSLRGLGRHTKRGASFLASGISGGALFAPLLGLVSDRKGTQLAMLVPLAGMLIAWTFPLYTNICKAKQLRGFWASDVAIRGRQLSTSVEVGAEEYCGVVVFDDCFEGAGSRY